MTVGNAITKLSAVGMGSLIGVGIGVTVPGVLQVVDLFGAIRDRKRRRDAQMLCSCIAEELEALRQGEYARPPADGVFAAAVTICTDTLDRHGLDSSAFLRLGLQPERAADAVLDQAPFNSTDRSEGIPAAARRILVCFYARLREEKDLLREVLPDLYGEIIRQGETLDRVAARTERIEQQTEAALRQLKEESDKKDATIAALEAAVRALARDAEAAPEQPALERALALLAEGKTGEAEAHFREVAERKTASGRLKLAEGADELQEAAEAARHLGALASLRSVEDALAAYRRAAELDPNDTWTWIFISRLERAAGGLPAAEAAAQKALDCARQQASVRDENIALATLGDLAVAAGRLPDAVRHFEANNRLFRSLAAADPTDPDRQRDLSVSWNRIGDVRVAQGDLAGALDAFTAAKAIDEKLAAANPGIAEWQRDLSVSWIKIGDVRVAQGDLAGALDAYTAAKAIAEKLAAADPGNAGWQRALSVSWDRIGDVRVAQGDLTGALAAYDASHAIFEKLAAADPGNAGWQRDLIVSHVKLSEVATDKADARAHLTAALEIARALEAAGRLAPVDAFIPGMLEQRLADLDN